MWKSKSFEGIWTLDKHYKWTVSVLSGQSCCKTDVPTWQQTQRNDGTAELESHGTDSEGNAGFRHLWGTFTAHDLTEKEKKAVFVFTLTSDVNESSTEQISCKNSYISALAACRAARNRKTNVNKDKLTSMNSELDLTNSLKQSRKFSSVGRIWANYERWKHFIILLFITLKSFRRRD